MNLVDILGVPIAATNISEAIEQIEDWIRRGHKAYVTLTGVHGIMESQYDEKIKKYHRKADLFLPDRMPTVWIGRLFGNKKMRRVYGPDLMLMMLGVASKRGDSNFFYRGKIGVPELLRERLVKRFPNLEVLGTFSPPFRALNENEENDLASLFEKLSPDITWIGLSTPKQEEWMATHIAKINTKVMIGVGAAFDYHAGLLKQTPLWMQKLCLEWLFRLFIEPKRLWKRYLKNNPLFIWNFFLQALKIRRFNYKSFAN